MNPGTVILFACVICVLFAALATVFLFRRLLKFLGIKELVEQGVVLTEHGIEFPRFIFMGRSKASYGEIESVELVRFPESLTLRARYAPSVASRAGARWDFRKDTVVIKFKPSHAIQYRLFTPTNPDEFVRKLKTRIDNRGTSA
jgi:hypothetical protein